MEMADSKVSFFKRMGEGIAGAFLIAVGLLTPFLRSWYRWWGATDAEVHRSLPGDELVPEPKGDYTHAITIRASAAEVWPWLVQIGQGRGGFYSYEWLENLVGCDMHNADRIIPELQHLKIGHSVPMHPKNGYPYTVAAIQPGQALVLQIRVDTQTGNTFELADTAPEKYQNSSWVFFLDGLDDGTTRLISRSRNDWNRSLTNALVFGIFGPISMVMDRGMLLGIKKRAEATA